jgi:hypothetical protein
MGGLLGSRSVSTTASRISSFQVTSSSYGSVISLIFGTTRVSGTLIDYVDFTAVASTTTTSSGGKGGSVNSSSTTYTYTVGAAIALGEGKCTGIGKIWKGSSITDLGSEGMTLFDGSVGQSPWGYMLTNHPERALGYSGTAYVAGVLDLGDSANMENYNFEYSGLCQSSQSAPTTNLYQQYAFQKTITISNWSSDSGVYEYVFGSGWVLLDTRFYTITQAKDVYGNNRTGVYIYTFNFDDRTDGYDRADPLNIQIHYVAITASVQFTATDANPRDIMYQIMTNQMYACKFPTAYIDDWSDYSTYCQTNSLLLSPAYTSQSQAKDAIDTLMEATNSELIWSQGKAKIIPYYDGLTPIYDITDDKIIGQEDDSLVTTRTSQADVYNCVPLEYLDRVNDYNTQVVYANDLGDIDTNGILQMSTKSHHEITVQSVAQAVAQVILQKQLYIRNTHVIKLGQEFILLEPMDPVTLTVALIGFGITALRVVSIKESGTDYSLEVTFEDNPTGVCSAPAYETQDATRGTVNFSVKPENVNYPVIFEAPADLVTSGLGFEVWIYASGGIYWGSSNVWISDDGNSYKRIGQIKSPARQGLLSSTLQTGTDPDTVNIMQIDMSMSNGVLTSGTRNDADNLNTICFVDGEFIAYETATLTATNQYNVSYLRRGAYDSEIKVHSANSQFVRMDDAVFKYPFITTDIGKTIYIKLTSINIFGGAEQNIADVNAYQYKIIGTSLTTPLPNVVNLIKYYDSGNMYLSWDAVTDYRSPIEYEIRKGNLWNTAEILGRTFNTKLQIQGNGNYFISAAYKNVYSAIPTEILIAGARYTQNVIAIYDEASTYWSGTLSSGVSIKDNYIYLSGIGNFDDIPDVDSVPNWDFYGGVASSGMYTIPINHRIDLGASSLCAVSISYSGYGDTTIDNFDTVENVDDLSNWDGNYNSNVSFKVQINIAGNDGTFSGWQDFYVGQYNGRIFDFRIILYSTDQTVTAIITDFNFSVDVPDIVESKDVSVPAQGITILYDSNFHAIPQPQLTIFNAQAGDDVILTAQTLIGFTVQVLNSGIGVARSMNYLVQSY